MSKQEPKGIEKKGLRSFLKSKKDKRLPQKELDAQALRKAFEELQVNEFIKYLRSPWRIMWHNFLAGVFKGLGLIVGMTVVFGVLVWILAGLVDFPVIGQYFGELKEMLEQFSEIQSPR